MKVGSYAGLALNPHTAAHHLHQSPGNSQTQTCSAKLAGGGGIGLGEGIEDHIQLFRGNAHTRIGNNEVQDHSLLFENIGGYLQPDFPLRSELEGVPK